LRKPSVGTFLGSVRRSAAYPAVMDSKGQSIIARDFSQPLQIARTLKGAELILDEGKRLGQLVATPVVQARLLRKTVARLGGECDSAIIEAIRPSRNTGAIS
jgi:3-hydroxyisobutyrate dehydrogenase-like beta-hydroxyacid dehydrogenase